MHKITPITARLLPGSLLLPDRELARLASCIYQRAGIVVNGQKREMIFNRLSRRVRELQLETFADYADLLESHPDHPEWQRFINALTTNLTSFFRESHHFPILAEHARLHPKDYRVWCAAAATGEEPCSIAITLHQTLGNRWRLWASDIDTEVLAKAQAGIYRFSDIQMLSAAQRRQAFLRGVGELHQHVKMKPELLANITYQQINLLDEHWTLPPPFDAIFCRNVMIYFDAETQLRLLHRFARLLKPGGLLFVGHSEHFTHPTLPLRLRGQSVYEHKEGSR